MAKHVAVIGAGIIGASVAWHLSRAGCAVTLIDAGDGGGVATPCSFAWINASWGNPEYYSHFRRRSMQGWKRLQAEVPGISVDWCGSLTWDLSPAELAEYADEHGRWGYDLRWVDPAAMAAIEPNLRTPPDRALHVSEEGMVEPVAAARAMIEGAQANGARVLTETSVARMVLRNGRAVGLETDAGAVIESDEIVAAAGENTAKLLSGTGIELRMSAPPGLIMHSTISQKRLLNGLLISPDLHVRQTKEGRLIAGSDFAGGDPQGRPEEMARDLLDRVRAMVEGAEQLDLDFFTVGRRPTPADGFPAIGRVAEGIYVTVLHSGVTLAPIVGELAARAIALGERDPDLAPYDPLREALA
ncbi:FAD-binding oxidoreductase [Pseudaminobacter sp. 19-2017]|uniref:FAD-binding oxidoreductase n=1 Tax=Pseudaminobacter soli (ex Zhang et al. 2022) TaxID=2831468 RepID=A0A942E2R8_9HYPH|nr:FAD-binding oxidoreductase [Pseudaminobacter soli]MBS3647457.1 FAD-binding oxidoreductase [Pseudaminobacter soli]